jgi:hypothetical protein
MQDFKIVAQLLLFGVRWEEELVEKASLAKVSAGPLAKADKYCNKISLVVADFELELSLEFGNLFEVILYLKVLTKSVNDNVFF